MYPCAPPKKGPNSRFFCYHMRTLFALMNVFPDSLRGFTVKKYHIFSLSNGTNLVLPRPKKVET